MSARNANLFGGSTPSVEQTSTSCAVRVAPDRPLGQRDLLTYSVPDSLESLTPGDRVSIPLGKGGSQAQATVIEQLPIHTARSELGNIPLKMVASRLPSHVPGNVLELARWVSAYYHAPLGPTIASILPAAVRKAAGLRQQVVLAPSNTIDNAQHDLSLTPSVREALNRVSKAPDQLWPCTAKQLRDALELDTVRAINVLTQKGYLVESRIASVRVQGVEVSVTPEASSAPKLTDEQRHAVSTITESLGTFSGILLEGVTGSGKTEVYLNALEHTLSRSESAIVLVPEIALTPQTASRFISRFPSAGVVVLHSAMTATQRHAAWRALEQGDARVALGPRSAIFAPLPHRSTQPQNALGLIVVDEEHDGSYKQDQSPRYHARDVALKRGQLAQCPVVLGSATPSLESFENAGLRSEHHGARLRHVIMSNRVGGGKLPPVQVVDLMHERAEARAIARRERTPDRNALLGPTLRRSLFETLSPTDGSPPGQAILLLNRRGYAGYIASAQPETEWVLMCQHCDVNLVAHKLPTTNTGGRSFAKCHHCGSLTQIPDRCPTDGSKLVLLNFGTQRLEEELQEVLAGVLSKEQIARVDADTMRSSTDYHETLSRFRSGHTRLLLGTQMIAKGLDFPNVRLIGVVNADTALSLPDFRASERTAQLIAQVAGRAGRSAESAGKSRVIVQTVDPENHAIRAAANHQYRAFADAELTTRETYNLPPAHRMARLVFRELDHTKANTRANKAASALRIANIDGLTLRGPAPAAITRVNDRYRVELVLLGPSAAPVQAGLAFLRNEGLVTADASCVVDVDPIALI